MKIEVGKRYRTRDGSVATVKSIDESKPDNDCTKVFGTFAESGGDLWCGNGSYYSNGNENARDLVAEVDGEQPAEAVAVAAGAPEPAPDFEFVEVGAEPPPAPSEAVQAFRDQRQQEAAPPAPSRTEQLLQAFATATHDVEAATASRRAAEQALAEAIEREQDAGARYEDARRELDRNVARQSAR